MVIILNKMRKRLSEYRFSVNKIVRDSKKIKNNVIFNLLDGGPESFIDYVKKLRKYGHFFLFTFDDIAELGLSAHGGDIPILMQKFFHDGTLLDNDKMSRSDYLRYMCGMMFMKKNIKDFEPLLFRLRHFIDNNNILSVSMQHKHDKNRIIITKSNGIYDMYVSGNSIQSEIVDNMINIGKKQKSLTPYIEFEGTDLFVYNQKDSYVYSDISDGLMPENVLDMIMSMLEYDTDDYRVLIVTEKNNLECLISITNREILINGRIFTFESGEVNTDIIKFAIDLIGDYEQVITGVPPV